MRSPSRKHSCPRKVLAGTLVGLGGGLVEVGVVTYVQNIQTLRAYRRARKDGPKDDGPEIVEL